jgi:hypothetical protein
MLRTAVATLFLTAAFSGVPPSLLAQARPAPTGVTRAPDPAAAPVAPVEERDARETRQRLREILNQYPPSVGQVLRVDPSLIGRADYLAPYPALAAFLAQHPEVAHNPSFFIGDTRFDPESSNRGRALNVIQNTFEALFLLTGFLGFFTLVGFLTRTIIQHRAWQRTSKVQAEAHAKLVDRMTSNEDLLAYIQTPTAQRAMGLSGPSRPLFDIAAHAVAAPVNRMLWSVQLGVVLGVVGVGMFGAKGSLFEEAAEAMHVVAILTMSLGVGFVLSSLVAYLLSRQLGLFDTDTRSSHA